MNATLPIIPVILLLVAQTNAEPKAPITVRSLWADFDPRKEPLDVKIVRKWEQDGIVYRYVTFHIRTFKGNPHHWQYWTRKINDPKWRGRDRYRLLLDVKSEKPNELIVVTTENFFRSYRGKQQDFVAVVGLTGGDDVQSVKLTPADFKRMDNGEPLKSWQHVDLLGFRAYHEQRRGSGRIGSDRWAGSQPEFRNLRWEKSE